MNIDIYCGNSIESWSPLSESKGIGGSEEAVINISRELTKLGHKVTVWNRCEDEEGDHDGVTYENYENYDKRDTDILIMWRSPQLALMLKDVKAKKYLWLHDTMPERDVLPIKYLVDGIFVLSRYHANLYPNCTDRLIVSQNGVNLKDFDQEVKRNPFKIVYGSSYDRGLKELLEMWGEVKIAVPEAELEVFYGMNGLKPYPEFKEHINYLLAQEGVKELGRLSHKEVAKKFMEAQVWAYPCWFPEISCITAMKAQIGGAIPVITPTAALMETVKWGYTTKKERDEKGSLPWGTNMDGKQMDKFVDLVIKALKDKAPWRQNMIDQAKRLYSWEVTAYSWNLEFTNGHLASNTTR